MDIETAQFGRFQNRLGQQQAIGHDDGCVGAKGGQCRLFVFALQGDRCMNRQSFFQGEGVNGAGFFLVAAPGRARRLGIDGGDIVPGVQQGGQGRHRKLGASHENEA